MNEECQEQVVTAGHIQGIMLYLIELLELGHLGQDVLQDVLGGAAVLGELLGHSKDLPTLTNIVL